MWRTASRPFDGLRLQVAGHRLLQRGPADAAIGLPAERHPQPGRNRARHKVIPLRRLLGYRGDGLRPACTAHRTRGHLVVGGRDRPRRDARRKSQLGRSASDAVIDRFDECSARPTTRRTAGESGGWASASPSTTTPTRRSSPRQLGAQRTRVRAGHHRGALVRTRRPPRGQGRLPGLRASVADPVAQHGHSGPLRIGLSASQHARRKSATPSTGRATPGCRRGPVAGGTTTPPTTSRHQRAVRQRRRRP